MPYRATPTGRLTKADQLTNEISASLYPGRYRVTTEMRDRHLFVTLDDMSNPPASMYFTLRIGAALEALRAGREKRLADARSRISCGQRAEDYCAPWTGSQLAWILRGATKETVTLRAEIEGG